MRSVSKLARSMSGWVNWRVLLPGSAYAAAIVVRRFVEPADGDAPIHPDPRSDAPAGDFENNFGIWHKQTWRMMVSVQGS
jgi:hypothetical protein